MVDIDEDLLLPDKTSIFSLSTNAINIFPPKYGQNIVVVMKCRMNMCFGVARNEVPVDIVLELHDALVSETLRSNACIWCQYIGWVLKICVDNLDKDECTCTWGECCTDACKIKASFVIVKLTTAIFL